MSVVIPATLIADIAYRALEAYLAVLIAKAKSQGKDEITAEDLEALRLEDPEEVIRKFQAGQGETIPPWE